MLSFEPHPLMISYYYPLAVAILYDRKELLKLLLEAGADAKCSGLAYKGSEFEVSPLHIAVLNNRVDMISELITAGADVNGLWCSHKTPLHVAVDENSIEMIRILLAANADLKIDTSTIIDYSAKLGRLAIVKILVEEAHVSVEDFVSSGLYTPLHSAVMGDQIDVARYLIGQAQDPDFYLGLKAWNGQTAYDLAREFSGQEMQKYLLSLGATVTSLTRFDEMRLISGRATVEGPELSMQ